MNSIFSIIEYQAFSKEDLKEIFKEKAEGFYKELEDFAKNNENLLGFKNKNSLKAKNYVGIIQTKSGVLEILPKCTNLDSYKKEDSSSNHDKEKLRRCYELDNISKNNDFYEKDFKFNPKNLLINMLKTLKNSPFKKSQISSLQSSKIPLFEVFITMFLDEFDSVYKKGLMRSYLSCEENRAFLKGKLLFNEHIKRNLIHKERFFTSNDEFVLDIAPNRLIKSTLNFLKSKTSLNKFRLIKSMQILDEVEFSKNYEKDFSYKISRHFDYYENLLLWCKIFLKNESFMPYHGKNEAFALLFPMEKIFEDYVAYMPYLSLLYLPGHIMLYAGQITDNNIAIHNIWGLRKDATQRLLISSSVITSLEIGKNEILEDNLLLSRLKEISFINLNEQEKEQIKSYLENIQNK
nr:restriction endonuclease [Campylobacter jejuni]